MIYEDVYMLKDVSVIIIGELNPLLREWSGIINDEVEVVYLSEEDIFSFRTDKKINFIISYFCRLSISVRYFLLKNDNFGEYQILYLFTNQEIFSFDEAKMVYTYPVSSESNIYLIKNNIRGLIWALVGVNRISIDIRDIKYLFGHIGGKPAFTFGLGKGKEYDSRAKKAVEVALCNIKDINEAKGVLFNITSGDDFSLNELNQINALILEKVRDDATVMVSTTVDNTLENILFLDVWYRT
jgi:cell division protein ftsZ